MKHDENCIDFRREVYQHTKFTVQCCNTHYCDKCIDAYRSAIILPAIITKEAGWARMLACATAKRQNVTNSAMIYERAEHSQCELRSLLASIIRLVSYDSQAERASPLMIA